MKSVAEEPALQKLLTSDEDSDEEKSKHEDEESDEDKKAEDAEKSKEGDVKTEKTKDKKKQDDKKSKMQKFYDAINQKPGTGNASDFSSDSEDSDADPKAIKKKKVKLEKSSSRSGTPVDAKRKIDTTFTNSSDNSNSPQSTPAKKLKTESTPISAFNNFSSSRDSFGNTEDAVRRYLMRKPMTTTELLKKIQSKKTGVSRDELVDMMTQILKKINPSKQMVQGKMYLSLKAQ